MTPTSDTLLGLAWYTFATCCSHRFLFPLLFKLRTYSYGLYNCFTKCGFVIMSWTGCNHYWACVVKHVVVISLGSPLCGVCLFDPRTGGCIGTLPDRPRIVPFEVRLSWCCLYGDGRRTWAGIIQVVLPHAMSPFLSPRNDEEGYMFVPIPSLRPVSLAIANWSPENV